MQTTFEGKSSNDNVTSSTYCSLSVCSAIEHFPSFLFPPLLIPSYSSLSPSVIPSPFPRSSLVSLPYPVSHTSYPSFSTILLPSYPALYTCATAKNRQIPYSLAQLDHCCNKNESMIRLQELQTYCIETGMARPGQLINEWTCFLTVPGLPQNVSAVVYVVYFHGISCLSVIDRS